MNDTPKIDLLNSPVEKLLRSADKADNNAILQIHPDKILPNPYQPRTTINKESFKSLVANINETGILQPLIVRLTASNEYELIAGQRRLKAAKVLKLEVVPAILDNTDDPTASIIHSISENLHREDLPPMDKARAINTLNENYDIPQKEIAKKLGMSPKEVSQLIGMLSLHPVIQGIYDSGIATSPQIIAILKKIHSLDPGLAGLTAQEHISYRDVINTYEKLKDKAEVDSGAPTEKKQASIDSEQIDTIIDTAVSTISKQSSSKHGEVEIQLIDTILKNETLTDTTDRAKAILNALKIYRRGKF